MAACMITCGRGLDDFVWQEILEKIPEATDLRHLGEGKIAFKVGQDVLTCALQRLENVSDENDERKTFREQKVIKETRKEIVGTSTCPKELKNADRTLKNQPSHSQGIKVASGISAEETNLWVTALSHIFKLRLVERVFVLLHCEDVDQLSCSTRSSEAEHQAGDGHSRADDILKDYENKLASLIGCVRWDELAMMVRRVREYQGGERPVWCRDPDSCLGSLRRRQAKQELREKRATSASPGVMLENFHKHQRLDNTKGESHKRKEARELQRKRMKLTGESELEHAVPNSLYMSEITKVQGISGSSAVENYGVHSRRECSSDTVSSNRRQYLQAFHIKDAKPKVAFTCDHSVNVHKSSPEPAVSCYCMTSLVNNECGCQKGHSSNEYETMMLTATKAATQTVDVISEKDKLSQSKLVQEDCCPLSSVNLGAEEVQRVGQDIKASSTEHTPTFRVSSRVSGPNKNILTVKWINRALTQQINKAMATWVPDWRQPLVDLYVNITSSHYIVGAALSPKPLSLRSYIPHLTLRSTISHLMARLSQLPQKATVLDPMCGGGSILVETAMSFDVSHVIGSDSSQEQLEVARCNLHNLKVSVTLLQASAEGLPLQDSSINTVLCDFPFGHKYKLTVKGQHLLAGVLKEMHRVLVCGGRAVFLLSPGQNDALCQLTRENTKTSSPTSHTNDCLTLQETHLVSLGETLAYVAVLFKEHP